ncbi:hypothetical protein ALC56_06841 [Trachymyrmex septentrionalis]|uniref:Uncharacterized protein n=1 Tax=Trachymyrmex septentrionalis TaxID=34720 RepID=A0A195FF45_9HYME|nr:hypothetical protein ALC56_06841 [Trachymyrmex septentrionalis]
MTKPKSKPPKSSDLNPLDYFLGGHLKSLVYTTPIENENDLRNPSYPPLPSHLQLVCYHHDTWRALRRLNTDKKAEKREKHRSSKKTENATSKKDRKPRKETVIVEGKEGLVKEDGGEDDERWKEKKETPV